MMLRLVTGNRLLNASSFSYVGARMGATWSPKKKKKSAMERKGPRVMQILTPEQVARMLEIIVLRNMSYAETLAMQAAYVTRHLDSVKVDPAKPTRNALLLVEHQPVYTVGKRREDYSQQEADKLRQLGAEYAETDRGGLITFHGPGQLMAYPILNLRYLDNMPVKHYIEALENVCIRTCKHFGIKAAADQETGVWVGDKKIAAIGVHARRRITTHGVCLNVCNDLSWFEHIVPCGIVGKGVTSMTSEHQAQGHPRIITLQDVAKVLIKAFEAELNCKTIQIPTNMIYIDGQLTYIDVEEKGSLGGFQVPKPEFDHYYYPKKETVTAEELKQDRKMNRW